MIIVLLSSCLPGAEDGGVDGVEAGVEDEVEVDGVDVDGVDVDGVDVDGVEVDGGEAVVTVDC